MTGETGLRGVVIRARRLLSLRRRSRILAVGWRLAPKGQRSLPGPYFVRAGYRPRLEPEYDRPHDRLPAGVVWQPDVYPAAARIATALGCSRIIDLGCGDGDKLVELYPVFEILGLDFGPNLEQCRHRHSVGTWLEHDLERDEPLPLSPKQLAGSVVVCADVIEHVRYPEVLLSNLLATLEHAGCVVLSTPERDLTRGLHHLGPPPNPAHVREWSMDELEALLAASGFKHGIVTLTRSDDVRRVKNTILALLFSNASSLAEAESVGAVRG